MVESRIQNGAPLKELIEALEVLEMRGDAAVTIRRIVSDSRSIQPGDLFVAVGGYQNDGHRFVDQAVSGGAAAVVVSREISEFSCSCPIVRVGNSRSALAWLNAAFWGYPSRFARLIGVTGTNGKTTLTYMLESILVSAGMLPGIVGTIQARFLDQRHALTHTTPEAGLLHEMFFKMVSSGVTHIAMEVSSHALSLERVRGCDFKVAVYTNFSRDHLDFHRDLESYAEAKSLLFKRELPESRAEDKVAVYNYDDPVCARIPIYWPGRTVSFGLDSKADVHPISKVEQALSGFRADIMACGRRLEIGSSLPGRHNLQNALAAVATAVALDLPLQAMAEGIENCRQVPGRMQRIELRGSAPSIFVDYAHTDQALYNVLTALRPMVRTRLWVVFGCGGDRDKGKRPLMGRRAAEVADLVVVTSDNPRSEEPLKIINEIVPGLTEQGFRRVESSELSDCGSGCFTVLPDREKAIDSAVRLMLPSDVLLIAGKGHENYQIVGDQRHDFDDCEQVRKAWERRIQEEGV